MDLESLEEIRQLKYRYFRTLDMKEWDDFGDCLADDNGERDEPCPCESRWTISCPTCGRRCRLELTDVPTFDAQQQR